MSITKKRKLRLSWKTNQALHLLAYAQKLIALVVAVYFAFGFLYPVLQKATQIPKLWLVVFILLALIIFELIMHFSLKSFIEGLFKGELEIINFSGAILTFVLIAVLGWYSTENLQYFRKSTEHKIQLVNIDSLINARDQEVNTLVNTFTQKERGLDSLHLPLLHKSQKYPYLFIKAESGYRDSKEILIQEKNKALSFTRQKWQEHIDTARKTNQKKVNQLHQQDQADAQSTAWIGLIVLIFSIYSTLTIAVYHPKIQTIQKVQSEVQTQSVPVVVNVNQQLNQQTQNSNSTSNRVSERRQLATNYYKEHLMQDHSLMDKEKFEIIQEKFNISWGTYSEMKRKMKLRT